MGNKLQYIILGLFFIGGILFSGYFEDTVFLIMNAVLYLGFSVVIWQGKSLTLQWVHLPVILIVLLYWISCIYAIDVEASVLEAARVSSLIPISLLAAMLPREGLNRIMALLPWGTGFMVLAGIALQLERNGRLESTLQYANALAIVCLVALIIGILNDMVRKSTIQLALLTINAVGLLLTFSRSVWVLWFIAVVVLILIIPRLRSAAAMLRIGVAHAAGLLIAMLVKGDMLFFVHRVSSIQVQTSEFQIRLVYWKDSVTMFLDHWIGGIGGGGWALLQYSYQSQPYYVKFIHNHYIQLLLDIGLIGGCSMIVLVLMFYKQAVTKVRLSEDSDKSLAKGVVVIVTVLFLHAGFDFDLTYPLLFALLVCVVMTVFPAGKIITINRLRLAVTISLAGIIAGIFMWIGIAYHWKDEGIQAVRNGEFQYALEQLQKAEQLIPWSSSILYETAKVYVHMGNHARNDSFYKLAETKLLKATGMVSEKRIYTDLLIELRKVEK